MKRLLFAASACAFALTALPGAASTAPAITAFDEAFAHVNDYTMTVTAHEVLGDRTQDRVYHYAFKRPNFAKTDIVSGDGTGSGGVWNGGDQVHGHLKIGPFTMGAKVGLHDGRATSLRGYTIPEGLLQNEVDKYRDIKGELAQRPGPEIDGAPTDVLELKLADPSSNGGVTRMQLFINRNTRFPVRQVRYAGTENVADETFSDVKLNVGLKDSDFPF